MPERKKDRDDKKSRHLTSHESEGKSLFPNDIEKARRLFAVLEDISFGHIWQITREGILTYASPGLITLLGYAGNEVIGKSLYDFQAPEAASATSHEINRLSENHPLYDYKTEFISRMGETIRVLMNAKPAGEGFLGTLLDVSGNRYAADSARESEERYKAVVDTTDTGYVKLDGQGIVLDANANYIRMTGNESLDQIIGRNVLEWTAPYDAERNAKEVMHCFTAGCVKSLVIDYMQKNGTIVPVEINATVLDTKAGKIIVTLCRDISERRATEKSLKESIAFTKNLIDTANVIIVGLDSNGTIMLFNRYAEKLTGYSKTELEGRNWFETLVPREKYPEVWKEFTKILQAGFPSRFENPILTKKGEERMIEWSNNKLTEGGKATGTISVGIDVTDRKLASEALRQSEERFRKIYEEGQFGITIAGPDFRFIGANPAFCRMMGYSEEELSELTFADITHPDNRDKDRDKVMAIKRGDLRLYKTEKKYIRKNGEIVWGSLITSAVRDEAGEILYYLAMVIDVTERNNAEETLRQSEEKYRSIIEQNSEGVVLMNKKGEIIEWNRAIEEISGIKRSSAIGRPFFEIQAKMISPERLTPEHVDYLRNTISSTFQNENNPLFMKPIEAVFEKDGKKVYILQTAFPIRTGNDYRIGLIVRDITERKEAEVALAAEKERLAITLRSIGDGVITSDIEGRIMMMNRVAEQLTGWRQEEATGLSLGTVYNIVDEHTRRRCDNPVERVLSSGQTSGLCGQMLLVSRDGTERVIADSGAPIKDNRGYTMGIVLVFRDTTEKQKLIDAAQKAQRIESLGILAGGIAHDFNNLLGGIYGNIEMMRSLSLDQRVATYVDATMSTLNRARSLTQQLLTFAKGGAPVRKAGALFPFIKETVDFSLSGSNVSCKYDLPENLWLAEYDANQIGQVIDNLVINAVQAMPLGGVITITAANTYVHADEKPALDEGRYVRISVSDTGVGIPREIQSRVFDPFFTTKQKGSGLGLATAYSIMKRHGGTIEIESDHVPGTRFNLFLPASAKVEIVEEEVSHVARKGTGRILVMDDEEVLRRTMRVMLESLGYFAITAKDGVDAIRILAEETESGRPFNAVILDLTIQGGMGGKETVSELRKIDATVPVIVSSGYADDPIMARPYEYGFAGSLSKPFTLAELSQLLRFVTGV